MTPLDANGQPHGEHQFVRTGLIGFLGPVSASFSKRMSKVILDFHDYETFSTTSEFFRLKIREVLFIRL